MNTVHVAEDPPQRSAEVRSFVEDTCHDHYNELKSGRQGVCFRLFSVGRKLRRRLELDFWYDYGVFYEPDDENLVQALKDAAPLVEWDSFLYHRWLDHSRIQVIDPEDDVVVAQIQVRRYHGRKVTAEGVRNGKYGENVVALDDLRVARAEREASIAVGKGEEV